MNHLIEAENVMILHKTYRNYQFPEDCIDFRTVEPGFISFFGGTYFTNNNAFFSLHEIFRNEDKTISAIYEIKLVCAKFKQVPLIGNVMDTDSKYLNIYHDPVTNTTFYIDASGNHVPYTDGMTLPDNYQIVFDTDWITNPTNIQTDAVYYFHIPCNIGEFALGSVKGKTGAYLMYLDIGTNGGDIYQTIVSTAGNAVTDKFNVDVRDAEDNKADYAILQIATDVPECASDDYSIKISFDESNKGPDNVHFKGLYTIEVVNNTGEELTLYALLCDDDDDLYDDYGYAYELIYTNGDHTETVYANEITALEYWQMAAGFVIP
ncbi:MAG: hypothetical protein KBS44_07565, partial [Clostridiales bacterium]|nr:hypothetical protein [Candidatus Coliplasma equi]